MNTWDVTYVMLEMEMTEVKSNIFCLHDVPVKLGGSEGGEIATYCIAINIWLNAGVFQ